MGVVLSDIKLDYQWAREFSPRSNVTRGVSYSFFEMLTWLSTCEDDRTTVEENSEENAPLLKRSHVSF